MRRVTVIVAITIIIVFSAIVIVQNFGKDKSREITDYETYTPAIEIHDNASGNSTEGYTSTEESVNDNQDENLDPSFYDVPEEIAESQVWKDFLNSEYYTGQEFIFHDDGDRITSDFRGDQFYVSIEYVFDKLMIGIYDDETSEKITMFE